MRYKSKWEQLPDALKRVMAATGDNEDEAKANICGAIADGVIAIRGQLSKHVSRPLCDSTVLEGEAFQIRTEIKPGELDWERSRPLKGWLVQRGSHAIPGYWHLAWIELRSADVTEHLCRPAQGDLSEPAAGGRSQTALEIGCSRAGGDPGSIAPGSAGPARRRGRRPVKFEQTVNAMRTNIQQGRSSVADLKDKLEKELMGDYGVSRDTARKARAAVLSEFVEN
jgi:hypothetical protein